MAKPPSFCPRCKHRIAGYDLIPVLSYLMLAGRCRNCGASIPLRELLIEMLGVVVGALLAVSWGISPSGLLYAMFAFGLLAIALVDLERYEVPPGVVITLGVIWLLAFGYHQIHGWIVLPRAPFEGVMVMLLVSGFAALVTRGRYGGGDWLIGILMGLYLGPYIGLVAWFIANFLAVPLSLLWRRYREKAGPIPFGPALAAASVLFLLPQVQMFWLHLFPYRLLG